MRAYLELLSDESRTVPTPEDEQATILNLENKARTENVRVLSGDAAWEALATMTAKLENYGDEAWTGFKRPKLFHGSMLVCCMIGSGYYRLVFRYGDPKLLLLTACAPVYQADAVTRALAPLYQKRQACSDCVDKTFTDPWLDKLNVPEGQRKRKYDFIRRALPVYPVTTLVDEKQHLMGQEIRAPKRRGRTVSPFHLTLKTYRKVVQQHLRRQCTRVQKSALNGVPVKELNAFLIAASKTRNADRRRKATTTRSSLRVNRSPAYQSFRRANWRPDIRPGTPQATAEQQRITAMWQARSPAQRQAYEEDAAGQRLHEDHAAAQGVGRPVLGLGPAPRHSVVARIKKRRLLLAVGKIKNHRIWSSGSKLSECGAGLKPDKVDVTATNEAILRKLKRFEFRNKYIPNGVSIQPVKNM